MRNRRRAVGYLGFKNARFGKIDAHIATCAYAREAIQQASAIAESRGFHVIHGIVDSLWLRKEKSSEEEYHDLCHEIETKLDLPISFEGIYKWIVFLNSRTNPRVPVLNRYYGVMQDGKMKVRGIDLRRHDTADIVRDCQKEILALLSSASNSLEFRELMPKAVDVARKYIHLIRAGQVPKEKLVLDKRLSKSLEEYRNLSHQAIAARQLLDAGRYVHAGQSIRFITTSGEAMIRDNRAVPYELFEETMGYDTEAYVNLLITAFVNLFLPLGYDTITAKEVLSCVPQDSTSSVPDNKHSLGTRLSTRGDQRMSHGKE
jgi:DNA polymerase elongation subunit (family B)